MGLLQSPDPAIKLARQYGIRGIFTPEIVPSLQPVVLIDDLTGGISNEPQRIGIAQGTESAVAAQKTTFRFETPPNVIAQITHLFLNPATGGLVSVHFGSSTITAPATIHDKAYTDGRLRSKGESPACVWASDTFAAAITPIEFEFAATNSGTVNPMFHVNWIIGRTDESFDFVELQVQSNNIAASMGISWIEFDAVAVR